MTRMTSSNEERREKIEDALAVLAPVPLWQQQVELRMTQAIERDRSLAPLLGPGIETVRQICAVVGRAGVALGEYHRECEQHGW